MRKEKQNFLIGSEVEAIMKSKKLHFSHMTYLLRNHLTEALLNPYEK